MSSERERGGREGGREGGGREGGREREKSRIQLLFRTIKHYKQILYLLECSHSTSGNDLSFSLHPWQWLICVSSSLR